MYVFDTERLKVRVAMASDAPMFTRWWNNGELMAPMGFPNGLGITVEEVRKRFALKEVSKDFDFKRQTFVVETHNGKAIGELTYGHYDKEGKSLGLAMKICDIKEQGKGYGKESLLGFMTYLFDKYSLDKIMIDSLADNERAMGLYQSVGFKVIEIKYRFWTDPQELDHDLVMMEMKRDQWLKM